MNLKHLIEFNMLHLLFLRHTTTITGMTTTEKNSSTVASRPAPAPPAATATKKALVETEYENRI